MLNVLCNPQEPRDPCWFSEAKTLIDRDIYYAWAAGEKNEKVYELREKWKSGRTTKKNYIKNGEKALKMHLYGLLTPKNYIKNGEKALKMHLYGLLTPKNFAGPPPAVWD